MASLEMKHTVLCCLGQRAGESTLAGSKIETQGGWVYLKLKLTACAAGGGTV